jgi:transcriptional regulator with XRE-family HTH domain
MSREKDLVQKAQDDSARAAEVARRDMEKKAEQKQKEKEIAIGEIYEMAGKIKATNFFKSQTEFFNLLMLKKVKDSKEYRERFGITWEQFCDHVGVERRTIDRYLEDLEPFRQEFLGQLSNFSGVTISKIKYLGMAVNEKLVTVSENSIVFNGETIPVDQEHAEEIQSLIETLEENHKKEKEETEATLRTKTRLLTDKEKTINKMEKEIMRLERTVEKSELTEEEQEGVDMLIQMQKDFLTTISDIKKKIIPHKAPEVVLRQLYYLYIFMSKIAMEERMALNEEYANAEEVPWEITEMELPPTDVMIDNLPMTAGKGMGKKVVEKMEERKAKKNVKREK